MLFDLNRCSVLRRSSQCHFPALVGVFSCGYLHFGLLGLVPAFLSELARHFAVAPTALTPRLSSGEVLLSFLSFVCCTVSTGTTPAFLLILCSSCNLLLPIKQYGEVPVEIRGSSHVCTGKCSNPYGEVHILRTGKFTSFRRFPWLNAHKRTGKFTPKGFNTVRESSQEPS